MTSDSSGGYLPLLLAAMDSAVRFVDGVKADQWTNATPCDEWDMRALVSHITYESLWAVELFAGKTMDEVGDRLEGDVVGSDPMGAFDAAVAQTRASATVPGVMEQVAHLSFGDFSGNDYAGQLFLDYLVHGWDVAKGSEQNATLDAGLCEACIPLALELTGMARAAGVAAFGTLLQGAEDAPAQMRLLAIVGRRADWTR